MIWLKLAVYAISMLLMLFWFYKLVEGMSIRDTGKANKVSATYSGLIVLSWVFLYVLCVLY